MIDLNNSVNFDAKNGFKEETRAGLVWGWIGSYLELVFDLRPINLKHGKTDSNPG